MYFLRMFGISLGLTLALEVPVAYIIGVRSGRGMLIVILVNILTNPLAVLAAYTLRLHYPQAGRFLVELPIEAVVWTAEALIYRGFFEEGKTIPRPVLTAILCNAVSYGFGLLL